MSNKKPQVDTPYEGSWAQVATTEAGQKSFLDLAVESAKKSSAIFWSANIAWYMKLFNVTQDEAYEALGYPKPIATITAAEYREMTWRPNSPPVEIGMGRALAYSVAGLAYDGTPFKKQHGEA